MAKDDFGKQENEDLYLSYKEVTTQTQNVRQDILDVLKNIVPVSKDLETSDHEKFNEFLLQRHRDALTHTDYDSFKEKREEEETIKQELYKRIEEIKNDPTNKQLLYLCRKLAGSDMDIDNFLEFRRIITYCKAREGKGAHLGLIDHLKDKGTESNLN